MQYDVKKFVIPGAEHNEATREVARCIGNTSVAGAGRTRATRDVPFTNQRKEIQIEKLFWKISNGTTQLAIYIMHPQCGIASAISLAQVHMCQNQSHTSGILPN